MIFRPRPTTADYNDLAAALHNALLAIQALDTRLRVVEFDNAIIGQSYAIEERERGVGLH